MTERSPSKAAQFRRLLTGPDLAFCMEAHNGLSAKIVEEAGFQAIWGSGLSISTAMGVRDRNEASWTQVLEVLEFMSDATSIPILLDGDTGYGDFNNFRRLVMKLIQRDVAAVCIEDKIFPKTNSFLDGDQTLADVEEFCGKIKAGKDSQLDPDFSVVARCEALISGLGMDEALRRCEAYHAAGADAVLIHSKKSTADEILEFTREWAGRCPVVIVPTKYYATPTDVFRKAGISMAIWANHNLRASIVAMRETTRKIFKEQTLMGVEDNVATLTDVFEIAGNTELAEAESLYMPAGGEGVQGVLLAASRGGRLGDLTKDKPKCMLDIRGVPLLKRLANSMEMAGIRNLTVIGGYKADAIDLPQAKVLVNEHYKDTGEVATLAHAIDDLQGDCVICYGDILFREYILERLLRSEGDIVIAVDTLGAEDQPDRAVRTTPDLAVCNRPFRGDVLEEEPVTLKRMSSAIDPADSHGEWIGIAKLTDRGARLVRDEIEAMRVDGSFAKGSLPELLTRLASKGHPAHVVYISGHWLDVNDAFGLARARNFM